MALFKKKTQNEKEYVEKADVVAVDTKTDKKKEVKDKKKDEKKSASKKSVAVRGSKILLGPVVTEKTAQMSDKNVIVFFVAKNANKVEVRNEIKAMYGIIPEKVNILNSRGKTVNFGRKEGKRVDTKKAMIFLPKGKTIDIFEGV